jgi:hypothetical protein
VREGASASDPGQSLATPPATTEDTIGQGAAEQLLTNGEFEMSSSGGCKDRNQKTCTSLEGVRPKTIERAVELQQSVGAPLVITGGTEVGHASGDYSHGNGYKLDFRTTPELNEHIENNFTKIDDDKWRDPNGNIYYRHGPVDHWDVTFTQ